MRTFVPSVVVAALLAVTLGGCSAPPVQPVKAAGSSSTSDAPEGFTFADMYLGGSWAKQPRRTPDACGTVSDNPLCWSVKAYVTGGCDKGWAMEMDVLDSYGDRITTYRERVESVPADQTFDHPFILLAGTQPNMVDELHLVNVGCI